jgi:acyl-coenzyme A synthetase/AMP-(fatty) acid ligase
MLRLSGGNVSPSQIRDLLLGVEGVAEAAVVSARLKAFIVPKPGLSAAELEARVAVALGTLPAPARPAPVTFGPALPRTAMAKLWDWPEAG